METETITTNEYKIMSFNILYADNAPGFGTVDERRPLAVKQIKEVAPDFVGMQECTEKWFDYLCEDLGDDYGYVGELNDPGRQRWRNPIFYRKDRFDLVETKTRWLTETPDVQSKLEEQRQYRIVTHVLLRDKKTGKQLVYCNTHIGLTKEERDYQFPILVNMLNGFSAKYPTLVSGDFNMTYTWPEYDFMQSSGYRSAHELTEDRDMRGTFPNGNMLDFCFVSPKTVNVISHRVEDNIGASDHNPIVIRFSLN